MAVVFMFSSIGCNILSTLCAAKSVVVGTSGGLLGLTGMCLASSIVKSHFMRYGFSVVHKMREMSVATSSKPRKSQNGLSFTFIGIARASVTFSTLTSRNSHPNILVESEADMRKEEPLSSVGTSRSVGPCAQKFAFRHHNWIFCESEIQWYVNVLEQAVNRVTNDYPGVVFSHQQHSSENKQQ